MAWSSLLRLALAALFTGASLQAQCPSSKPSVKPRVFLLSDIANEPDDAQSLVRLLTYANELRIEGLVATTSVWLNDTTRPDQMHDIVDAYDKVLPNLRVHADGWPEASQLHSLIASGLPVYGMDGVGEGRDSEGSRRLVAAVDASDEPLWIPIWGGASVLAQALWHVNSTRGPAKADIFTSKIRAYAISDQDNTGTWIRRHWPHLFYVASVHHFNRYALAAWSGISGEQYYNFPCLADGNVVSPAWIAANIQSAGALGAAYPDADFIVEGDTPSLLYLIPNGLSDPEYPEWGSWGGRYGPVNYGEGHYADTIDAIRTDDGNVVMGSHLTIWRWRTAFQNDFAARINWGVAETLARGRHAPVAAINGDRSRDVLKLSVVAGQEIVLDASESCDPDGEGLTYKWWQYLDPTSTQNTPFKTVPRLELSGTDVAKITVTVPGEEVLRKQGRNQHPEEDKHLHLILEVSNGELVAYRRVVFTSVAPVDSIGHDEL
ncbi:hypothetical protein B0T11DRAFT_125554 [Plectosphaerella cucumerina]|uniref:Cellulose-binding protein n=1 Tax=Plectosphaerella cucumerina TaxID=40658 RepID=A0A8K0X077_9PEZI|nr:hypothetical protein B0T11DRAFT_125554 [Plectosphaerella cucumerina]